jgi:hypothetical protein
LTTNCRTIDAHVAAMKGYDGTIEVEIRQARA